MPAWIGSTDGLPGVLAVKRARLRVVLEKDAQSVKRWGLSVP